MAVMLWVVRFPVHILAGESNLLLQCTQSSKQNLPLSRQWTRSFPPGTVKPQPDSGAVHARWEW